MWCLSPQVWLISPNIMASNWTAFPTNVMVFFFFFFTACVYRIFFFHSSAGEQTLLTWGTEWVTRGKRLLGQVWLEQ